MMKMSIRVKTHPKNQQEFEQTVAGVQLEGTQISGLIERWRNEKGCISYHLQRKSEDEFCLESQWGSREELENHFRSKGFMLLMGAIDVLCEPPEVEISDGKSSFGKETIRAARGE
jgi:quinol monooxygenase YgiN